MADGFFPTLVSKDANANSISNQIFVQLTDGTDGLLINGDGSLNATVTATNLDIRDLTHVSDSVKVGDGTDFLAIAADGSIAITDNGGSLTVDATNLDIRDLVFATDKVDVSGSTLGANSGVDIGDVTINNAAGAAAVNIQDGGNSITVDGSVSITGSVTVTATDLDIRDITRATDSIQVSANTSANSAGNPIFVAFTTGAITGEVHDYATATVAGGGTSNHDYTVVTAMLLKAIEFSCSGGGKVELQVGPVASLVSKWVGFVPKQGGIVQLKLDPPIEVPTTSTGTVRLIRTNREGSSQDVYSTIIGIDA
jgi:hypothetical protein